MPRGNLESFEPRPLLLIEAKRQLRNGSIYECLIKLRKQKVDLNLVVDFDHQLFLSKVPEFVADCLNGNAELLSLLISSLENGNIAFRKYGYLIFDGFHEHNDAAFFNSKVNIVCSALRLEMSKELGAGRVDALNPILCSFAKQYPPQLVCALKLIRKVFAVDNDRQLYGSKAQSALKYLSFVTDTENLFRAALSECDFGMCRAIARQSQMDPKVAKSHLLILFS